jgi:hypothetical protein
MKIIEKTHRFVPGFVVESITDKNRKGLVFGYSSVH